MFGNGKLLKLFFTIKNGLMKKLFLFFLYIGLLISELNAQERYIELVRKYRTPQFFIETLTFPTTTKDSVDILVDFKTPYNFLVFHQTDNDEYQSSITFSVEVLNDKNAVNRKIIQRSVDVKTFKETEEKGKFLSASTVLGLKAGKYKLVAEFFDNNTQKLIKSHTEELEIKPDSITGIKTSEPLFLKNVLLQDGKILVEPLGFSEKGFYGKAYVALLKVISNPNDPLSSIHYVVKEKGKNDLWEIVHSGNISLDQLISVSPKFWSNFNHQNAEFSLILDPNSPQKIAIIDFDSKKLSNANYELQVTVYTKKDSASSTYKFENAWINMPYPLYDIDLALRLMENLLTPEETNKILSGNDEERKRKFDEFWKAKDPTPDTEFNEVMEEFFRRVDYTFFNFYTPSEFGWRTDRGKVFILYGQPKTTDREFPFNKPTRETWTYGSPINKTFIFEDDTNTGNFKLIKEKQTLP